MGIPQLNRVQPERSVGDRGRTRTCNFRPLRPVWRSAPPPYIARKPLVPLERQSARETAPQHGARSGRRSSASAPLAISTLTCSRTIAKLPVVFRRTPLSSVTPHDALTPETGHIPPVWRSKERHHEEDPYLRPRWSASERGVRHLGFGQRGLHQQDPVHDL